MEFPSYKIALVVTNYSILSFLVLLMFDHYKSNFNVFSWSSCFHFLCLLWLLIRGAFWLRTVTSTSSWGVFSFYCLYWLPNPIQFASFLLIPLFFTQILYPEEWKKYWVYVRPVYYFILISLVVFQVLWALLAALAKNQESENFRTEYSSDVFRGVTAFCFTVLATCQGIFAVKISQLEDSYYQRYFMLSSRVMAAVNLILVLSFLSKGIYQFGAIFENYLLPDISLQGSSDVDVMILLTFEIWEYIPTILLVMTVTSKSVGSARKKIKPLKSPRSLESNPVWSQLHRSMERNYGSFNPNVTNYDNDDDVVSICSETQPFSSSFEKSAQMLTQMQKNDQFSSPNMIGIFEAPSSLNPKTSWLAGSLGKSQTVDNDIHGNIIRSAGQTPENPNNSRDGGLVLASQNLPLSNNVLLASSSSYHASSMDRLFKKSDMYMVSLRQQMRRGNSEDTTPPYSVSYGSTARQAQSKSDIRTPGMKSSSLPNISLRVPSKRTLSWGSTNNIMTTSPRLQQAVTLHRNDEIASSTSPCSSSLPSKAVQITDITPTANSTESSNEFRETAIASTATIYSVPLRCNNSPISPNIVITAMPKPTRFSSNKGQQQIKNVDIYQRNHNHRNKYSPEDSMRQQMRRGNSEDTTPPYSVSYGSTARQAQSKSDIRTPGMKSSSLSNISLRVPSKRALSWGSTNNIMTPSPRLQQAVTLHRNDEIASSTSPCSSSLPHKVIQITDNTPTANFTDSSNEFRETVIASTATIYSVPSRCISSPIVSFFAHFLS